MQNKIRLKLWLLIRIECVLAPADHFLSRFTAHLRVYLEGIFKSNRIFQRENPHLNSRPQQNRLKVLLQHCSALSALKKKIVALAASADWNDFISLSLLFGFEQLCVSSDSFLQLVVRPQQKNYRENTFLSARHAESAQTRPFSYYFLSVAERQKNVYRGGGCDSEIGRK